MYESFYHLSANPFRLTPDPRFCFSHSTYQESHAYLLYAIELGEGFILLTGRPGAGKTTLIQGFLGSLDASKRVAARIAVTDFEASELLRAVAYNFGIDGEGLDKATLLRRIEQFFMAQVQAGRRVLLVIDEAQRLSHASLEELRLLADLQLGIDPLLQIFLVGQDALREVMDEPDMEQLQQRVIGSCRLDPLNVRETRSYIEHRLRQAGWQGVLELTGAAVLAVYEYSQGVPRHINKICTRLLLQGFMEKKYILDREDVQRVGRELGNEQLAPLSAASAVGDVADSSPTSRYSSVPDLSELAVRADSVAGSVTPDAPAGQATDSRNGRQVTGMGARPGLVGNEVPVQAPPRRAVVNAGASKVLSSSAFKSAGHPVTGAGLARLLSAKARLGEQPVMLFSLVAVVVLSVGIVIVRFANSSGPGALPAQALWREVPGSTTSGPKAAGEATESLKVRRLAAEASVPLAGSDEADVARPLWRPAEAVVAEAQMPTPAPAAGDNGDHGTTPESPQLPADSGQTAQHAAAVPLVPTPSAENAPAYANPATPTPAAVVDEIGIDVDVATSPESAITTPGPASHPTGVRAGSVLAAVGIPADAPAENDRQLPELLSKAQQALRTDRLLIPAGRSAYDYYQQALLLDPDNTQAQQGINRIVSRYTALAGYAVTQGDAVRADKYIDRGLRVQPDDERLLAMRRNLKVLTTPVVEPEILPQELPPPALEKPAKPGFLQRFKTLFSDNP